MADAPGASPLEEQVDRGGGAPSVWPAHVDTGAAQLTPRGTQGKPVRAGISDWGGVSPVTPDHVNPEAPWPHLQDLADATNAAGRDFVERLALVPRQWRGLKCGRIPTSRRMCAASATAAALRGRIAGTRAQPVNLSLLIARAGHRPPPPPPPPPPQTQGSAGNPRAHHGSTPRRARAHRKKTSCAPLQCRGP